MPKRGDIAVCSHGHMGLITCDKPSHESGTAGNVGAEVWTGVHLRTDRGKQAGGHWQSRKPAVIASLPWLADVVEKARKWDELLTETHEETRYVYEGEDGNGPPTAYKVQVPGPAHWPPR